MVQVRGSSRRYAAAAFELARESGGFAEWTRDLGRVAELLSVPEAQRVLTSPAVAEDERLAALWRLAPGLSAQVQSLLEILVRRDRLELVPEIVIDFERRVDEYRGVTHAVVTTAVPLDAEEQRLVNQRLARFTGKEVRMELHVDPSILGGVIARLGDELLDDSVRGRLERLHRRLAGGMEIAR